jgi:hypothetical protein
MECRILRFLRALGRIKGRSETLVKRRIGRKIKVIEFS